MITTDQLPAELEAERGLIGCVIANPDVYVEVRTLPATDFIDPLHIKIWRTFQQQHQRGGVDPMLAARELEEAGYFLELGNDLAVLPVHAAAEAAKIMEARKKRQWYDFGKHVAESALNGRSSESIRYEVECTVADVAKEINSTKPQSKFTLRELFTLFPKLKVPVIEGWLRRGETANLIAPSKAGKSWLVAYIGLSVVVGLPIFGRFNTTPGKVLLFDNELHPETLAHRLRLVAEAMGLTPEDYADSFEVRPLRGNLRGFHEIADDLLSEFQPGDLQMIIWDAKYRFLPAGASENDSSTDTQFYNLSDRIGAGLDVAQIWIHHSSKGGQADKRATDVGSGSGAQSRAADAHLVLREHEDPGVVVLDGDVRSFPPIEPLAIRWNFPLWFPADDIDPSKLKGKLTRGEQRQTDKDREGVEQLIKALREGPATARQLRAKTGMGKDRQQRLLDWMTAEGHATTNETTIKGNVCHEYTLSE